VAVALFIAALVSGVAFFLRTAGLNGAANFTQVLSAFSLIIPLVTWARSKKSAEQERVPDRQPTGPKVREPSEVLPPRKKSARRSRSSVPPLPGIPLKP
jgi:hypothetical protein